LTGGRYSEVAVRTGLTVYCNICVFVAQKRKVHHLGWVKCFCMEMNSFAETVRRYLLKRLTQNRGPGCKKNLMELEAFLFSTK